MTVDRQFYFIGDELAVTFSAFGTLTMYLSRDLYTCTTQNVGDATVTLTAFRHITQQHLHHDYININSSLNSLNSHHEKNLRPDQIFTLV